MPATAPSYAEFIEEFPEFATAEKGVVERQLTRTTWLLAASAWGDAYHDAVGLDVAHHLTLRIRTTEGGLTGGFRGATGPVTSVSAAGASTSFATPTPDGQSPSVAWYSKTSYGQEFLRLRSVSLSIGELTA